jgi:mannose-6-phosphate isomerase
MSATPPVPAPVLTGMAGADVNAPGQTRAGAPDDPRRRADSLHRRMLAVEGTVLHYDWGDLEAIPRLLGREPDGSPQAEWWIGTHPSAPSTVTTASGERCSLVEISGPLPFLAKLLAARRPLSLQVHPDAATAAAGFAREDDAEIDRSAEDRVYRDPFEKTEVLCALTRFEALCGFRPLAATEELLRSLVAPAADRLADRLSVEGLASVVRSVLLGAPAEVDELVDACRGHHGEHGDVTRWIVRLAADRADDPALVVALLLNHVVLEPGEAIYLSPGHLHTYLGGVGVEVMSSSDNVLRAGFTTKHVDIPELLRVVRAEVLEHPGARIDEAEPGQFVYDTPGTPFRLTRIELDGTASFVASGPELLLCTAGNAGGLDAGQARYVPAGEHYMLAGPSQVFRVESASI